MDINSRPLGRRDFLRGSLAAAALAATGSSLAACATSGTGTSTRRAPRRQARSATPTPLECSQARRLTP